MDKSRLLSILDKYSFIVEKSEVFSKLDEDFIYCVNKDRNISIIIKQYKEFNQMSILDDVIKVRGILRENNINIWNSYYLISFVNSEVLSGSESKVYSIERNSRGLRKYVIINEEDLYRMPFIKPYQAERVLLDFKTNFNEILETEDKEITKVLRWIMESNGDLVDIKKQTIKEKISEIYFGGELGETK